MQPDWTAVEPWIMGQAWVRSKLRAHLIQLCHHVGPRWATSEGERRAADYVVQEFTRGGLKNVRTEEVPVQTWEHSPARVHVPEFSQQIDALPFLFCPEIDIRGPLIDVGYGMPHELETLARHLPGAIAILSAGFEPFSNPVPLPDRLRLLALRTAAAALVVSHKPGRRLDYLPATDWRDGHHNGHHLPTVLTSHEHGLVLRLLASEGRSAAVRISARFFTAIGLNVVAELPGKLWPEHHILVAAHHDTVPNTPGGNDNASGVAVTLETARILDLLHRATGAAPGCTIKFVTMTAEEQTLQGSRAFVERHYGPEPLPRLALHLDELATGPMKGVELQFDTLREFVQRQLDAMDEGLGCHVKAQLDAGDDAFPFSVRGIQSGGLWRWRFVGKHTDADFHHELGDTFDKVRYRELKEYVGFLARLLLRLSHVSPSDWPENSLDVHEIERRLEAERGSVIRTM